MLHLYKAIFIKADPTFLFWSYVIGSCMTYIWFCTFSYNVMEFKWQVTNIYGKNELTTKILRSFKWKTKFPYSLPAIQRPGMKAFLAQTYFTFGYSLWDFLESISLLAFDPPIWQHILIFHDALSLKAFSLECSLKLCYNFAIASYSSYNVMQR